MSMISLMALSSGPDEGVPPHILIEQDGVWRDTPAIAGGSAVSLEYQRGIVDELLNQVMAKEVPLNEVRRAIVAACMALYNNIFPDPLQDLLRTAADEGGDPAPTLRVHVREAYDWIPWELLHDGVDFLGRRFAIARLPIVATPPDMSDRASHPVRRIRSLLAENVLEGPADDEFELWRATFEGLVSATVEEYRIPPESAGGWPTLEQLTDAQRDDIFHVTCHGGLRNPQGEIYWTLNHRDVLPFRSHVTPQIVRTLDLSRTKPLVFGNACASAGKSETRLSPGLATTFFSQGALNFVGTFAPITRKLALDFARKFYEYLLGSGEEAGLAVADALWATKRDYAQQEVDDPSYLFYCLYGPPDTRFHMSIETPTKISRVVAET